MSDSATLEAAAALIRENAECLRICHVTPAGEWLDDDAEVKEHYEYEIGLANQLAAMAERMASPAADPLGAALNVKSEGAARLLAQIPSTDGLGVAVPPAPTFE